MAIKQTNNPKVDLVYRKRKSAEEMRHQVITFALMIFNISCICSSGVSKTFSPIFSVPFILLLAVVQVIFQLYYFMHMSHKGHEATSFFLYSGLLIGLITILAFMTIVWI